MTDPDQEALASRGSAPLVSVVMPAYEASATLDACLTALSGQTLESFEVVVVDGSPEPETARRICEGYPFVRFLTADPALGAHAKRNLGVESTRGSILVFTDPDCAAVPEWLEILVHAHEAGYSVVGGSVDGLDDPRNRDIHLSKYAWWLPGSPPGARSEIPSANTSITREIWERFGPYREDRWAADSELSWRLCEAGVSIRFEPAARIIHLDHGPRGSFLGNRLERGDDFGLTRAEHLGWGRARRFTRALFAPVVPLLMTARAAPYAWSAGRFSAWVRAVPFQLLANACWALGEARALLRPQRGRWANGR
jgi:glycosyltransferase involved in cell wall biosynthesis